MFQWDELLTDSACYDIDDSSPCFQFSANGLIGYNLIQVISANNWHSLIDRTYCSLKYTWV